MNDVRLRRRHGGGRVLLPCGRSLDIRTRGGWVERRFGALVLLGRLPDQGEHAGVTLHITHPLTVPRIVHVPHLSPEPGQVAGDFVFRSPALLLADEHVALAFIPDLDDAFAAHGFRALVDYDHRARRITFGAGDYDPEGHTFFRRKPLSCRGQRVSLKLHLLASTALDDLTNPYGMAARFFWQRWGKPRLVLPTPNANDAREVERSLGFIVRWAFDSRGWGGEVWQNLPDHDGHPAGAPVFIVDVGRHPSVPIPERTWREPRSIWNQAWFSTQRCANGLFRYARRVGAHELSDRARAMTEVALSAPEADGLFPSVLMADAARADFMHARWQGSDRRPASVSAQACHLVDAAFTARQLLDWHEQTGCERSLVKVRRFADRALALQRESGAFPAWVEPDGRIAQELADSAESAVIASLLVDLTRLVPAGERERAALARASTFIEALIAEARWEDFETYYSCAPWGQDSQLGRRVDRNGVFKQNTLSLFWCAELMAQCGKLTLARRCIDELSLHQAVHDPPFLLARAHGGFGVMNADCEWNDARQSLFAPLYLELYERTGDEELLERAAAALRASLSLLYGPDHPALRREYERSFPFFGPESFGFMMENQGHAGRASIGTFTIFSWGPGSALATIELVREKYPLAFARIWR